jgi:hypothetical protein
MPDFGMVPPGVLYGQHVRCSLPTLRTAVARQFAVLLPLESPQFARLENSLFSTRPQIADRSVFTERGPAAGVRKRCNEVYSFAAYLITPLPSKVGYRLQVAGRASREFSSTSLPMGFHRASSAVT